MSNTILLFGGSFDPIHLGHLKILKKAVEFVKPKYTYVIPAFLSPFKIEHTKTSALFRYEMLKIALTDFNLDQVLISDYEIKQEKSIYSFDTIMYYQNLFPNNNITLLVGEDSYHSFHKWYKFSSILENITLLVFKRESSTLLKENKNLVNFKNKILLLNNEIFPYSSSLIRKMICKNLPINSYVTSGVAKIIKEKGLY